MDSKLIGIVGGMGPEAGVMLSKYIILNTKACCDNEHLPQILYSTPSLITDRTDYLLGKIKINPAYPIIEILKKLELLNVVYTALACNTAHSPSIFNVILNELKYMGSKLNLLNIVEEVGKFILEMYPEAKRIGILSTKGTYITGLYDTLIKYNLEIVNISIQNQEILHNAIYHQGYGLKSNIYKNDSKITRIISDCIEVLSEKKSDLIILGCTELSSIKNAIQCSLPIIDASEILARALIKKHSPSKLKEWIK